VGIKHTYVSPIADAGNPGGRVDSNDWNDDHTIDGDIDLGGYSLTNVTNINGVRVGSDGGFNVLNYEAVGDGTTDDTAAFVAAITAMRASYNATYGVFDGPILLPSGYVFRITSSLNLQDLEGYGWGVVGLGRSVIYVDCAGKIALDCFGSQSGLFRDLVISGDATDIPAIGIAIGKHTTGATKGGHLFENVVCRGYWADAGWYVGGSEVNTFIKGGVINSNPSSSALCMMIDGMAYDLPTSDFTSPSFTVNTPYSCINNHFHDVGFAHVGGGAVVVAGATQTHFDLSYLIAAGDPIKYITVPSLSGVGDLSFECHAETLSSIDSVVTFEATAATSLCVNGLKMREDAGFAPHLIKAGTNIDQLTINGADINWRGVTGRSGLYTGPAVIRGMVNGTLYPIPPAYYDQFAEYGVDQSANLTFVLDPADYLCYPGSGETFSDRAPSANDFMLGSSLANATGNPTFTGNAGSLDGMTYWGMTSSTSLLQLIANPTEVDNLHKDSAVWSADMWVWFATVTGINQTMISTSATGVAVGINWRVNTGGTPALTVQDGVGNALSVTGTAASVAAGGWKRLSIVVDEAAGTGFFGVNGVYTTFTSTYSSPSSAAASNLLRIGMMGNGNNAFGDGSKVGPFSLSSVARTQAQDRALFDIQRTRYGL
jgi:hypothetical protein